MEIYPHLLWRLLLYSFFSGMLLGAVYDTLRLSRVLLGVCHYIDVAPVNYVPSPFPRRDVPPRKRSKVLREALLVLEDLAFCLVAGALVMILLFYGNDGGFRGFVLLGLLAGFLVYYATLGALVVRASEFLIFWLKVAVLYAVYYITRPFVIAARFLWKSTKKVCEKAAHKLRARRIRRYDAGKRKELLELSEKGFVGLNWKENGNDQTYRSNRGRKDRKETVH